MAKKAAAKKDPKPKLITGNHGSFTKATVDALAGRACWICSNPTCQSITIASTADDNLATKVGEAAHIHGEQEGAARWIKMDDDPKVHAQKVRHIDNGIWLCARCHAGIDKNKGKGFPADVLRAWRSAHEEMLKALLLSGGKILPYLRTFTKDGQLAQSLVDELGRHGSMFQEMVFESESDVLDAIERLRKKTAGFSKQVKHDNVLKARIDTLYGHFRDYMNYTSAHPGWNQNKLIELRGNVSQFLLVMQDVYDCKVEGRIREILPK
jgi:hypothetical protein